jgi:hypothetical protein
MAGITAAAASKTLLSGDTSADKVSSTWVTGERITLGVTPSGTTYQWGQAAPSGSRLARSALSSDIGASVTFTPDVGGTWTITCLVDGVTTYSLRLVVAAAAIAEPVEAVRFSPRADSTIPAPAAGRTMYFSSDQNALVTKDPSGVIRTVDETAVP